MPEKMRDDEFDAVFAIMEQSFPKDEYRPYEEQRALLADPRYTLYVHRAKGGEVDAFLAVWQFEAFAFLEHFAVLPEFRGAGIGSEMLQEFIENRKANGGLIFLEAEPITDDITARRIAFYKRNGFFVNDYDYCQPAFSPSLPAVPLKIVTYGREITKEEFNKVKRCVYVEVYNQPE